MRKVLSVVVALSIMLMLSAGAVMAKPLDVDKGNAGDKAMNVDKANAGDKNVTVQKEQKAFQGQQLKNFKQKLDALDAQGEVEEDIPDIDGHWAEASIKKMKAIGVFKGYEDGTFRPEDSITQAEITVLVMRMANQDTEQEDEALETEDPALEEVPDWAKASVKEAVYNGVVNLNRFHSQVQADRAQVAVELAKALELTPVDTTDVPFVDGILISQEDLGYIMALYQEGILKGTPDGSFNPNSAITRAEMAVISERVIEKSDSTTNTEQNTEQTTQQTTGQ